MANKKIVPMKPAKTTQTSKTAKTNGGETHQQTADNGVLLTTNQGLPISDNQNSLKGGGRGPTLLEDFILREKITHFDHERIPERIVHARGSAAHGYFQPYKSMSHVTSAGFLSDPKTKTPVFARFSTVAGGAGSVDTPRDVRGFAVKFYTQEGNFDLVGNNIPVFFIQDAIKFPDLIHAVKMEADRGYPQAGTAHDTFWDFISLMPESLHMVMWAMSDRTIPRSLRMMEGFGVNTFRLVNSEGKSKFVKFHWRPLLGTAATLWDEAVKIAGADPDFQRRDLFDAIATGNFPEFEFGIQTLDDKMADKLDFDVLDATKVIPEEIVPVEIIGKMVLDRNPDNFFAETEQVAFCPSHVVPGIDFSEDPLLQGRLFSYLDTQLSRLGSPNFHQLPINAPKCPFANMQRDGHMQMQVHKGRGNYEPNSIEPNGERETPAGFRTAPVPLEGTKVRLRAESFADHYSQARLFYRSVTPQEQKHMAMALTFELSKVGISEIRKRMLGHLDVIDQKLAAKVADGLGMTGEAIPATPALKPIDLPPSPALRLYGKYKPTLKGRKVGVLLADGFDAKLQTALVAAIKKEGATPAIIAPKVGGVMDSTGKKLVAEMALAGSPSVFFDAVAVLAGPSGDKSLSAEPDAISFLMDADRHLKAIACAGVSGLAKKAHVTGVVGVTELGGSGDILKFIEFARNGKVWERDTA
ncbi:MAG: catalase [Acidobacteriota bacterium]|nr:catalase [Acidobacteriota bacterium]